MGGLQIGTGGLTMVSLIGGNATLNNTTVNGTLEVTDITHLVDTIITGYLAITGWMVLNGNFTLGGILGAVEIGARTIKATQSLTVPSGNVETLIAAKANLDHTHSTYSLATHTHSTYAASTHTHTSFNALSLTGTTTVAALTASGAVTLNGATTTKNLQVNGDLNVTGKVTAGNIFPIGYVLTLDSNTADSTANFNGNWTQEGVDGIYSADYNAFTKVNIMYHGRMANCQILCLNFGRGDNVTYNLSDWGLSAYLNGIPIHVTYTQWNSGNYLYVDSSAWRVTYNSSANSINVDSRYGNASMKPDYMLEFNCPITNMSKVMTLPAVNRRLIYRRTG
jgi:hypothetical protein